MDTTWLIEHFTVFGIEFQNWMLAAITIIVVAALAAWWKQG
jgi:hypothetical protein